tara:strand:- start:30502 stop:31350 length:849 start_codon:yes stop_codon:yes gene_type:complete
MKIAIIGFGFVGKALFNGLDEGVDVLKVDPKLNTSIKDLLEFKPEVVFICLPTPMKDDGSQDISIVKETLDDISKSNLNSLIVLKSTVHPGNIKEIQKILPEIIYNPEFLREKHADEDFINSKLIIFGGRKNSTKKLAKIYSEHTKCINDDYIHTDATAASLLKYTINSFLATKVIFFNELNNLFNHSGTNESWENFTDYLSVDERIGDSHMMVPGHDGRLGFGGACFPKDTKAILKYAETMDIDLSLIKSAISTNNKIRAKYNSNTEREDEQNIKYNEEEI